MNPKYTEPHGSKAEVETPRTDALADKIYARGIRVSEIEILEHARKTERELNQACEERDRAYSALRTLINACTHQGFGFAVAPQPSDLVAAQNALPKA